MWLNSSKKMSLFLLQILVISSYFFIWLCVAGHFLWCMVNVRVSLCGLGKGHISPHFSESGVQLDAVSCLEAVDQKQKVSGSSQGLKASVGCPNFVSVTKVLINLKEMLMGFLKLHCRSSRALSLAVIFMLQDMLGRKPLEYEEQLQRWGNVFFSHAIGLSRSRYSSPVHSL